MKLVIGNVTTEAVIGGTDNLLDFDVLTELREYLRVRPNGYHRVPSYQEGKWDGYKHFITTKGVFATGFLPYILSYLHDLGVELEIIDKRGNLPVFEQLDGRLDNGWELYDYQLEAVGTVNNYIKLPDGNTLYFPRGIIDAATNAGKNSVIAGILQNMKHGTKCIFLIHNQTIFKQAVEFFGSMFKVGQIKSSTYKIDNFTIAMAKTLYNRAVKSDNVKRDLQQFDVLIVDECFAMGTKVDGKPIEKLKIGDKVKSYNHEKNKIEYKEIVHIFKKESSKICKVLFSNGCEIVCTEEHPFFCTEEKKYLPIKDLLHRFVSNIEEKQYEKSVGRKKMYGLRKVSKTYYKIRQSPIEKKQSILFRGVQKIGIKKTARRKWKKTYSMEQRYRLEAYARKQPNEISSVERENENNFTHNRTQTTKKRWKWSDNSLAAIVSRSVRVGYGGSSKNRNEKRFRLSYKLQNRYSQRSAKNSNRSRWVQSLLIRKKGARQKENYIFGVVRVESIEVYEQGSGSEFEHLCKKGIVYNLEVADNNNYFVENLLVHNCHRAGASDYSALLQMIDAPVRVMVSGTPLDNADKVNNMVTVGLSGPSLYKVSNKTVIEKGYSQKPTVRIYLNETIPFPMCSYRTEMEVCVFNSKKRNELIRSLVEERDGNAILIAFNEIEHGDTIMKALSDLPYSIAVTSSKDPERNSKIEDFKNGRIDVLIASNILKEGANMPVIRTFINAQSGKSKITVKQFLGRALRHDGINDEVEIIDFYDLGKYLSKHSRDRIRIYKDEEFDIEYMYEANWRGKPTHYMQY